MIVVEINSNNIVVNAHIYSDSIQGELIQILSKQSQHPSVVVSISRRRETVKS